MRLPPVALELPFNGSWRLVSTILRSSNEDHFHSRLPTRGFIAGRRVSRSDPRRDVGARGDAKALRVASEAECGRRYGSLQGTTLVSGMVVDVEISKTGQRTIAFVTAEFNLVGLAWLQRFSERHPGEGIRHRLAEELIDNCDERIGSRERQCVADESEAMVNGEPRNGLSAHLNRLRLRGGALAVKFLPERAKVGAEFVGGSRL
jgi:hypothetical protein